MQENAPDYNRISGLHATCVSVDGQGVLILGKSGAGKTELALTLIERGKIFGRNVQLVADDRTLLNAENQRLVASAPPALAGGIEIRGAGLFKIQYCMSVPLALVVQLVSPDQAQRYPDGQGWCHRNICVSRLLLPAIGDGADSHNVARAVEMQLSGFPWLGGAEGGINE